MNTKLFIIISIITLMFNLGVIKISAQSTVDPINELKVSPDGVYTAISYSNGGVVLLSNQDQSELVLRSSTTRISAVMVFSWHPTEAWLAGGDDYGNIMIWDITVPEIIAILPNTGVVVSINWFSDGNRLLAGYVEGGAIIWDITSESILTATPIEPSYGVDLHPDETRFIMVGWDNISFWNVLTGEKIYTVQTGNIEYHPTWSPNGDVFAVWSRKYSENDQLIGQFIDIRDEISGDIIQSIKMPIVAHAGGLNKLVWSSDGKVLYLSALFGNISMWDSQTGNFATLIEYDGQIGAADILPDGSQFVFGGLPNNDQPATVQYAPAPQFPKVDASTDQTLNRDQDTHPSTNGHYWR